MAELPLDKVCQCCIFFIIFYFLLLSGMFAAPLWIPPCTVLACGGARINQSKLLHLKNFRRLSAGSAESPLNVIFSVWGSCLQFQRVHESTLLTHTCLACSGVKKSVDTIYVNIMLCILIHKFFFRCYFIVYTPFIVHITSQRQRSFLSLLYCVCTINISSQSYFLPLF